MNNSEIKTIIPKKLLLKRIETAKEVICEQNITHQAIADVINLLELMTEGKLKIK